MGPDLGRTNVLPVEEDAGILTFEGHARKETPVNENGIRIRKAKVEGKRRKVVQVSGVQDPPGLLVVRKESVERPFALQKMPLLVVPQDRLMAHGQFD
jgi:hypothetical protein